MPVKKISATVDEHVARMSMEAAGAAGVNFSTYVEWALRAKASRDAIRALAEFTEQDEEARKIYEDMMGASRRSWAETQQQAA